jgi:hypothetical protein
VKQENTRSHNTLIESNKVLCHLANPEVDDGKQEESINYSHIKYDRPALQL